VADDPSAVLLEHSATILRESARAAGRRIAVTGDGTGLLRRRLPRHERERLIVEEAVRFFAEVGFEGQTRALAQRLGVTQPLLYRYFPDKGALIERLALDPFVQGTLVCGVSVQHHRCLPLPVLIGYF